ncbi:hypothetical protein GCM10023091_31830 [Ravibacter arvi]|uniref:histidine kinase n=2 Tax=Ravibacter arvi TaxID=2051041 RepID=A0ABP8M5Q8_9BACT
MAAITLTHRIHNTIFIFYLELALIFCTRPALAQQDARYNNGDLSVTHHDDWASRRQANAKSPVSLDREHALPAWYQTWHSKTFIVLVAAFVVYLIPRATVRRIEKRNHDLKLGVAEHTQELQETLHALRSSEEELRRQLRFHIRMIAAISHDVRTPVHYIRLASEGIESSLESDEIPNAKRLASTICTTSKRLLNLLDSMVAFTKYEMSPPQSLLQEISLRHLVIEKTELFKPILAAQQGRLHIQIPDDLMVVVNPNLLAVIIHNLVDNAVKVRDGNTVQVAADTREGTVHMAIHDNGPGMPPELVKWLNLSLSETCRAKPMPEKYDGLGLIMVREIAQILGIQIAVKVEDGTIVHLMFPGKKTKAIAGI